MSLVVGFPRLMTEVVRADKCALCGTCEAVCPVRVVKIDGAPALKGKCLFCDVCYAFCPVVDDAAEESTYKLLNPIFRDENIGGYANIFSVQSRLKDVLKFAQDGGFVTSLLIYLVDNEMVDGALLTVVDEEWRPKPSIATTKEEVLDGAGTSYAVSPNLKALNEAVSDRGMKTLAVVGTPCQIEAVRKLQLYPNISGLGDAIHLTIGLFCTESFDYNVLRQHLEHNGVDMKDVRKFAITRGRFLVTSLDERTLMDAPIKDMKSLARSSCHYCVDYTAEYADISVGSVGSPDGWSTVIVRSEKGTEIFKELAREGYIESKPIEQVKPGIDSTIRESKRKRGSAKT